MVQLASSVKADRVDAVKIIIDYYSLLFFIIMSIFQKRLFEVLLFSPINFLKQQNSNTWSNGEKPTY